MTSNGKQSGRYVCVRACCTCLQTRTSSLTFRVRPCRSWLGHPGPSEKRDFGTDKIFFKCPGVEYQPFVNESLGQLSDSCPKSSRLKSSDRRKPQFASRKTSPLARSVAEASGRLQVIREARACGFGFLTADSVRLAVHPGQPPWGVSCRNLGPVSFADLLASPCSCKPLQGLASLQHAGRPGNLDRRVTGVTRQRTRSHAKTRAKSFFPLCKAGPNRRVDADPLRKLWTRISAALHLCRLCVYLHLP